MIRDGCAHTKAVRTIPEPVTKPRRLRSGSRVALLAPAGPVSDARVQSALRMCARLGLEGVVGAHALRRTGYLAGNDAERAADLQQAIDDASIDAIWALRGGYGTARLLHLFDVDAFARAAKPYIGFSDNTTLLIALARRGAISFHAPHAGGDYPVFADEWFRRILFDGTPVAFTTADNAPLESWSSGVAEGRLVGGNLAVIAAAEGTPNAIPSDGAILFIEDIAEPAYRVDRLITQLVASGALDRVAGIVVGQFTDCDRDEGSSSDVPAVGDVLREMLADRRVPIVANAPIGHVPDNWTLPVAARVRLDADNATLTLLESATTV